MNDLALSPKQKNDLQEGQRITIVREVDCGQYEGFVAERHNGEIHAVGVAGSLGWVRRALRAIHGQTRVR